jgi:hypothetical protein
MFALAWGLAAGLARIGWPVPAPHPDHLGAHGPLMIGGFLGTVISLERGVAYGRAWGYAAPALSAAAVLALAVAPGAPAGPLLLAAAGAALVAVSAAIASRHPSLHVAAMAAGAACWLAGNALWASGWPVWRVVAWWIAFPVLTIAGERLELTRMLPPSRFGRAAFVVVALLLVAGAGAAGAPPSGPPRVFAAALLLLAAWLLRFDVARRTIRGRGLARFTAACLLSGYVWLGVGGALALAHRGEFAGPVYDAALHAVLVGFVFAMILGHAPIIFPAVIGGRAVFHPRSYLPLVMLQASVALRVAGDLSLAWGDGGWGRARPWGGALGTAAIVLFLLSTAASLRFRGDEAGRHAS